MHTVLVLVGGFLLSCCFGLFGYLWGGSASGVATALQAFIPVWLIVAAVNMWVGVARAGYSFQSELPIFLVIAALPAAGSLLVARHFGVA